MKTFVLIIVIAFTTGCRKNDTVKNAGLGAEVSPEDIASEILEVTEKRPIESLRMGEQAHYLSNVRIENSTEATTIGETNYEVTHYIDKGDYFEVVVEDTIISYEKTGNDTVIRERVFQFEKNTLPLQIQSPPLQKILSNALEVLLSFGDIIPLEYKVPTYHNLQVFHRTMDPPENVKRDPNCRDLTHCEIQVKELQYDYAVWISPETYQKYHFVLRLSSDLPHLALRYAECASYTANITTDGKIRNYLISTCLLLNDFAWE